MISFHVDGCKGIKRAGQYEPQKRHLYLYIAPKVMRAGELFGRWIYQGEREMHGVNLAAGNISQCSQAGDIWGPRVDGQSIVEDGVCRQEANMWARGGAPHTIPWHG